MNRRNSLKLLAIGGILPAAWSSISAFGQTSLAIIYDGRFPVARTFAKQAKEVKQANEIFDCQIDAAALWYRSFAGKTGEFGEIHGLTSPADALILADFARREGHKFTAFQDIENSHGLTAWQITGGPVTARL